MVCHCLVTEMCCCCCHSYKNEWMVVVCQCLVKETCCCCHSYNNEWMIVDYKRFQPGMQTLPPGVLTVLDQIPYVLFITWHLQAKFCLFLCVYTYTQACTYTPPPPPHTHTHAYTHPPTPPHTLTTHMPTCMHAHTHPHSLTTHTHPHTFRLSCVFLQTAQIILCKTSLDPVWFWLTVSGFGQTDPFQKQELSGPLPANASELIWIRCKSDPECLLGT